MTDRVCTHEQQYMSMAVPGGWEEFPMRCLECWCEDVRERRDGMLCEQCGAPGKPREKYAMEDYVEGGTKWVIPVFCASCARQLHPLGNCKICGRFAHQEFFVGFTDARYDSYWGPEPPEEIFEYRCKQHEPEHQPQSAPDNGGEERNE